MRRLLLHLSTALVAFALGVATALVFGVFSFTRTEGHFIPSVSVEQPPAPRACPNAPQFFQGLPEPPLPPAPPAAPLPPSPPSKGSRVVIRRPDGTVQVIETERRVERRQTGT